MEDSIWLLCPNLTEVRRFQKNNKSEDKSFEYIFIDRGLILWIYGDKPPLMETGVSVKIEEARESCKTNHTRLGQDQTMLVSILYYIF